MSIKRKVETPLDLQVIFAEALQQPGDKIEQMFDFEESKEGYLTAKNRPKVWLQTEQFRLLARCVEELGGQWVREQRIFRVPGPALKQPQESTPAQASMPLPGGESIPVVKQPPAATMAPAPFIMLPVASVLSNPFPSRLEPEDPELQELTESIRLYGVLEPILVRLKPSGSYEIVAGERRLRAAKNAGLSHIPAIAKALTDEEAFILQLTENLQRKDLTEEEKSRGLGELARRTGWNAQQIADKLKMSYTWVVKYLPSEFKAEEKAEAGKAGGEARAEAYRESQDFATRRVAEPTMQPQPLTPTMPSPEHVQDLKGETQIIRRKFDVWNIAGIDLKKPFGNPSYPGAIPGDIVGNVLLWFLPDGGKIVDPMAGGGVTEDVCKFLGSDKYQCLLFDSKRLPNHKYRESIRFNDIATGSLPQEAESVDLVFADPPYGPLKEYGMNVEDLKRVIAGLAQASYKVLKLKGKVAVLMQNYYEGGECTGNFVGLVRQTAEIFEKSGFTQIFEVTVPLYGKVPRNEATMTHIDRRLMVFQK